MALWYDIILIVRAVAASVAYVTLLHSFFLIKVQPLHQELAICGQTGHRVVLLVVTNGVRDTDRRNVISQKMNRYLNCVRVSTFYKLNLSGVLEKANVQVSIYTSIQYSYYNQHSTKSH